MIENLVTLGLLVLLQVVLGFDNLLYISLESKRAPADKQASVRKIGIALAVVFRIGLLIVLYKLVELVKDPFFHPHIEGVIEGHFNLYSLITLAGGAFIIYTATKEIFHMLNYDAAHHGDKGTSSVGSIIAMIVVMNLVFSFDSILSAMALTNVLWVMATAIVIGGCLMIWLADGVADFLQKNRMYEVLGLFILFVVGIMLLSEGGHLAHLHLFGHEITSMSKATFYFVIGVLVLTDVVQSRYRKRLMLAEKAMRKHA
ncbi:MAG: putative tellurium resistance membrane protein TerC [Kiritimatiellia bacterium]|jgi:predicted tellurium resistance membrane protein TerC